MYGGTIRRVILVAAATMLALSGSLIATPSAAAARQCFVETGFCIEGRFLDYWQSNGGLIRNGYPLSIERVEMLEDGREYTVQYFERVRLEHHPENPAPYDVLLGQFGRRALRAIDRLDDQYLTRPHEPRAGATFFPETDHNVSPRFYQYWVENGGLAQFGYPITEEVALRIDGRDYGVQYFERARFEYHPENVGTPYDVLLGQFGRAILADADYLNVEAGFNLLYQTDPDTQRRFGRPVGPAAYGPGAYQGFERGLLLWRGDTRQIYALCGGNQQSGPDMQVYDDTWSDGQPVGGGPGPRPGLHEPARGFGKVWRENQLVRDCLGYATDPAETAYTIAIQPFQGSAGYHQLISATTPQGRFIYRTYYTYIGGSSCIGNPALCRPDYDRVPYPIR